jgi:HAUS augmin-like complex subunit 1
MAHLSPSAIFSPSVARQQLAAAKDWNYVDSWLSTKFSGKTPPFERNNDTLKALLALAALNESADEERDLLARIESKALQDLQANTNADPNAGILSQLEEALTQEGEASLDALSSLSVLLNQPAADTENLGRRMINLQVTTYNLDQASDRISILEKHLNIELDRINNLIKDLESDAYQCPPNLTKETTDYQRRTKALAAQLPDLKDRVASLSAATGIPGTTVEDVKVEEQNFKYVMAKVNSLENEIKKYHGLPQDTDLARLELESLRIELRDLTRQRDSMFEGLVERESPKKTRS